MKIRVKRLSRKTVRRPVIRPVTMQAAAVCYRRTEFSAEFLLVNTSAGKWTFLKGRIAPEMSIWEAAEQEALEEAGAIGTIEESCLGHYTDLKRALGHDNRSREVVIAAYLLEVETMCVPQESGRNPTWFTPEAAKERLAEQRDIKYSREISRIVDVAENTIRRAAFSTQQSSRMTRLQESMPEIESLDGMDSV